MPGTTRPSFYSVLISSRWGVGGGVWLLMRGFAPAVNRLLFCWNIIEKKVQVLVGTLPAVDQAKYALPVSWLYLRACPSNSAGDLGICTEPSALASPAFFSRFVLMCQS